MGGPVSAARALSPEVRNPVLALEAVKGLQELPPESRAAMRALLQELARDARGRAELSWRKGKGPMAAYWKAVAVYAGHTARALR